MPRYSGGDSSGGYEGSYDSGGYGTDNYGASYEGSWAEPSSYSTPPSYSTPSYAAEEKKSEYRPGFYVRFLVANTWLAFMIYTVLAVRLLPPLLAPFPTLPVAVLTAR